MGEPWPPVRQVIEQANRGRCAAWECVSRARAAVADATATVVDVQARRRRGVAVRRVELAGAGEFTLLGSVGDDDVLASYRSGRLVVDGPLWQAAETVVDLDETFEDAESGFMVPASLDTSFLGTLLTLVRAADRISSIVVRLPAGTTSLA